MRRILVVEDEKHLAKGLQFNLEAEGHDVAVVETGEAALDIVQREELLDLIVLDVMLPGINGFEVAMQLRQAKNFVPILMLTARNRSEDVLKGLESGADDYLPKPFDLSILMARINSLLRRTQWMKSPSPVAASTLTDESSNRVEEVYEFGNKIVDLGNLEIRTSEGKLRLTLMEVELIRYFIRNAGRVISRKEILDEVWGLHEDTDTRAIDNFIVRLRRYLEEEPAKPKRLLTVRGVGYRFEPDESKDE